MSYRKFEQLWLNANGFARDELFLHPASAPKARAFVESRQRALSLNGPVVSFGHANGARSSATTPSVIHRPSYRRRFRVARSS